MTCLAKVRRWLDRPDRVRGLWLGRNCVLVAWLGLLAATLCPPHGSALAVCWFHRATGLPCPGCGLTRSLSCGVRGLFLESWHYHPLGLAILALFLFTAGQSLLPKAGRDRVAGYMQSRPAFFNALYLMLVGGFVSFGALRTLVAFGAFWLSDGN